MIPEITAIARSKNTVITVTRTTTKASAFGIFDIILRLDQANVFITTINITPTSAAIGIISIAGERNNINASRANAATIPDNRPLPPEFTLIMDWPIIAQPPIPPKKPFTTFASP